MIRPRLHWYALLTKQSGNKSLSFCTRPFPLDVTPDFVPINNGAVHE